MTLAAAQAYIRAGLRWVGNEEGAVSLASTNNAADGFPLWFMTPDFDAAGRVRRVELEAHDNRRYWLQPFTARVIPSFGLTVNGDLLRMRAYLLVEDERWGVLFGWDLPPAPEPIGPAGLGG
jgi:hypothetical protein